MDVVCLAASDRSLLCSRYLQHGNSHRRMFDALAQAGADEAGARLLALRRLERRFDLDLAEICHLFARRHAHGTNPIERQVVEFIAEERHAAGDLQLWILPHRVRQVRELMDGKLVGDLES
jgi:hypothetical protein